MLWASRTAIGDRRSRGHLARVSRHARAAPGVRIAAVADLDAPAPRRSPRSSRRARRCRVESCSRSRTSRPSSTSRSRRRTPRSRSPRSPHGKDVYGEKPLAATLRGRPRGTSTAAARPACGRLRAGHRARHRHADRARAIDAGRHRAPGGRDGRHGLAGARALASESRLLLPAPAAARCWTWGRTTSPRWSHLLGPVVRCTGAASRLRDSASSAPARGPGSVIPVEVDTHVAGVLEHVGGALSTITMSFDGVRTTAAPIEVHGETGSLAVPDPNTFDGEVQLFALGGERMAGARTVGRLRRRRPRNRADRLHRGDGRAARAGGDSPCTCSR